MHFYVYEYQIFFFLPNCSSAFGALVVGMRHSARPPHAWSPMQACKVQSSPQLHKLPVSHSSRR